MRTEIRLLGILFFTALVAVPCTAQENSFEDETVAYDIELSSQSELQEWVDREGLPAGSVDEMKDSLYRRYGLERMQLSLNGEGPEHELKIEITRSDSVAYGENIELSGNVEAEITPSGKDQLISISSERLIINQVIRQISVIGSAQITITEGESTTKYLSDACILDYDQLNGLLVNAVTRSDRTNSDDETIEFYLTGDSVLLEEELMNFENSFFTSDVDDSFYGLRAEKMKILPNGDWFMTNANLRLGRVPILFLPFFYYPADTLIFRPSFGIDSERGMFLNTSWYILGSRNEEDTEETSFSSFMKFRNQEQTSYVVADGPVLSYAQEPANDLAAWAAKTGSYIAVYADAYQYDGLMTAFDASLQDIASAADLDLYAGISIDDELSIDYLLDTSFSYDSKIFDLEIELPIYRDPESKEAFWTRKQHFDLDDLFGGSAFEDTSISSVNSYSWKLEASFDPALEWFDPFIEVFSVSGLEITADWDSYDSDTGSYELDSIELPSSEVKLSGTLFDISVPLSYTAEETEPLEYQYPMDSPISIRRAESTGRTHDDGLLSYPERKDDQDPEKVYELSSEDDAALDAELTYSLKDSFQRQLIYDENELSYTDTTHTLTGTLAGSLSYRSLFTIEETVRPYANWDVRTSEMDSVTAYDDLSSSLLQHLQISSSILDASYTYKSYLIHDDDVEPLIEHSCSFSQGFSIYESTLELALSFEFPLEQLEVVPELALEHEMYSGSISTGFSLEEDTSWSYDPVKISVSLFPLEDLEADLSLSLDVQQYEESLLVTGMTYTLQDDFSISGEMKILADRSVDSVDMGLEWYDAELELSFSEVQQDTDLLEAGFRMTSFEISTGKASKEIYSWKNRIHTSAGIEASWELSLTDYLDNEFSCICSLDLSIAEFLDLTFSSISKNTATYTYFLGETGVDTPGILEDLLMSFNFFDREDRVASNFNLDSIQLGIVHYMQDWDLHADASAGIGYDSDSESWEWIPEISVYLQWKAIPELDFEIEREQTGNTYEWSVQ